VNSLPKTVTRQRRGCDLNPGPSAPESSTLTTRLPSHPVEAEKCPGNGFNNYKRRYRLSNKSHLTKCPKLDAEIITKRSLSGNDIH